RGPWPRGRRHLRRITGQPKTARTQAAMKPGDEAVDVVDRHLQPLPQRAAEWDHVRALEHDRANVRVLRDELVPRREDVLARCGDVERHLAMCHDTPEFTSPFGADDRSVGSCT